MKYKLLKDLPGYSAGTAFNYIEKYNHYEPDTMRGGQYAIPINMVENDRQWFEPIDDTPEWWTPELSETYYYVTNRLEMGMTEYEAYGGERELFATGNCFKTREQAEKTAEALREVYKFIHTDSKDPTFNYEPMLKARKDVQQTNRGDK